MRRSAYEILDDFDLDYLKMVYEMAGVKALKDEEKCPATYEDGIRIPEVAEEFVAHLQNLSRDRVPPMRIAASALRFLVWRQPFKNCNHRTGYAMCRQILEMFGYEFIITKDEITSYVFSINRFSYSEKEVEEWLNSRVREKTT
jgi:hypothetical protein